MSIFISSKRFHSYLILHCKTVGFPFRNSAVHDAKQRLDIFVRSERASHARLACVDRSRARFTLSKIRVVLQSNFTYFYTLTFHALYLCGRLWEFCNVCDSQSVRISFKYICQFVSIHFILVPCSSIHSNSAYIFYRF